jgi:riboflavin kinase/FMN adenylyltransferase
VDFGDEMVSSTRIRRMITEGRMQGAGALLGRNFVLTGTVVDGFKLGRRLGKPTMNLRPDDGLIVPATGVYASRVLLGGEAFFAITNIGTRPTFSNDDIVSVESHIMDFCRDIYGEKAAVELVQKVRDERRFDSETELVRQIDKDMAQARLILSQEYGG